MTDTPESELIANVVRLRAELAKAEEALRRKQHELWREYRRELDAEIRKGESQ